MFINENDSAAQYTNYSRLHLKNGVQLEQIDSTWCVYNLDQGFENEMFKYDEVKDCYIFECENLIEDLVSQIPVLHSNKEISASHA
jgi:hypothetical protein